MPIIDLTLPESTLDAAQKAQLLQELTHILLKWEGRQDNPRSLQATWAYIHEVSVENHTVGGKTEKAAPCYQVIVTVPQGVLSDEAKNGLVGDVTKAILQAEGAPVDAASSLRIYCLLNEVPDGNWGTAGRILWLKDMAALVKAT